MRVRLLSSLSSSFEPTEVVETIEVGRTYPKNAVVSYLTGKPLSLCFKGGDSGELVDCSELRILIEFFGLLPLGPPKAVKFFGQHIIDAQIRRNTDSRIESPYCRTNMRAAPEQKVDEDEGVGPTKSGGGKEKGQK